MCTHKFDQYSCGHLATIPVVEPCDRTMRTVFCEQRDLNPIAECCAICNTDGVYSDDRACAPLPHIPRSPTRREVRCVSPQTTKPWHIHSDSPLSPVGLEGFDRLTILSPTPQRVGASVPNKLEKLKKHAVDEQEETDGLGISTYSFSTEEHDDDEVAYPVTLVFRSATPANVRAQMKKMPVQENIADSDEEMTEGDKQDDSGPSPSSPRQQPASLAALTPPAPSFIAGSKHIPFSQRKK